MKKYSQLFSVIFFFYLGCLPQNKQNSQSYKILRGKQIQVNLEESIRFSHQQLDLNMVRIKTKAKQENNSDKRINEIKLFYYIKKNYFFIEKTILKCIEALDKGRFKDNPSLFVTSPSRNSSSAARFKIQLDEYSKFLKDKCQKYLPDTTSWSRRYLKQFANTPTKEIPGFEHFYFDGTTTQEAIQILRIFQLAIAQEELAIQQNILKEK